MSNSRVVISGGGIGGLSAALSLAQQGFNVQVLEQAEEFADVGAGIQLSPNATRVLDDIGVLDAVRARSFQPEGGEMRVWKSGEVLTFSQLGDLVERRFGSPYLNAHRADLVQCLADAAQQHPAITLQTGARVSGFEQHAGEVSVVVEQEHRETSVTCDVLIGADGIHSVVQAGLFGHSKPRFTGNVAWRALVPAAALPQGVVAPRTTAWWGPGKHFVHYYVRDAELLNCVCVVEKSGWQIESWTEPGDYNELRSEFAGWHDSLQVVLEHVEPSSLYKWALFDRQPLPVWSKGHVTLLGDACHPTLPFMAQGAAMAIEDGAVLARCLRAGLDEGGSIPEALQRYERLRMKRTAAVQLGSRSNARIFHLSGLPAYFRNLYVKYGNPKNPWLELFQYDALTAHL